MNSENTREDKWIAIKIFLTVFLISGFFFKPDLTFGRFEFLTKALTHYGTTWIDKVEQESGIKILDSLAFNGHTFIEPTPGLSFIALASYLPYAVFLQSRFIRLFSLGPPLELRLSQFIMAISTVTLFTALLIAIFFLSLRKIGCTQKKAIIFSFLLYFGTPFIFYSLNVANGQNILEAALLYSAFFIICISKMQNISLIFLSGLLSGLAIFVNAIALFFLPLFPAIIILAKRWRNLFFWIIGAILGAAPFLIYNQISFGNLLRISYGAKYGNFISSHLGGYLGIVRILLVSPTIGLIFFFPFAIMLILKFKNLWANSTNKFIIFAVIIYTGCLCIIARFIIVVCGYGSAWYLNQGGGGPRYLLPIIPFLLYAIASIRFELKWERILAAWLIFISVIINTSGLFWTGGRPIFYNNLLVFFKNGFHSYMIDLIRDMLISGGFNTNNLSVFPLLTILGIFLWWIWIGSRWIRDVLSNIS